MAEPKKLAKFTVSQAAQGFKLHIEDEAGSILELAATRDQLDVIDEALEELLAQSDDTDEIKS